MPGSDAARPGKAAGIADQTIRNVQHGCGSAFCCGGAGCQRRTRRAENGDGALYGTSASGGSTGRGLIYRLDPNGSFAVLHAFTEAEGREPSALIQTRDGNFYGMLVDSISRENGRVFRSTQAGETTVFQVLGGVDAYAFSSNEPRLLVSGTFFAARL